jgi:hypothetical protein
VGDQTDTAASAEPARGEILPPVAPSRPDANAARALVGRLVRGGDISPELLTLVDGPLADAVAVAADYADDAITATTRIWPTGPNSPPGVARSRSTHSAADPPRAGRG